MPLCSRGTPSKASSGTCKCGEYQILYSLCFILYTHTFSHKGSTLQLFFSMSKLRHHYSCSLGLLLSKIRISSTADLITKMATKWVTDEECEQWADAGLGEDSRPGRDRADIARFHHAAQNSRQFKTEIVYFCKFPVSIFKPRLTLGNWNSRKQNHE